MFGGQVGVADITVLHDVDNGAWGRNILSASGFISDLERSSLIGYIILSTSHLTEERSLSQRSMWLRYLSLDILVTLVRVWAMKRTRWDSIFLNLTFRLKVVHRKGSVPSWWSLLLTLATLFKS